jgi:hypothetical protein
MSRSDKVLPEDLKRLRDDIRSEVATQFALSMGEVIVTKVLERLADRASNIQRAQAEAETKAEEARKLMGVYESRSAELRAQLKELSDQVHDKQDELARIEDTIATWGPIAERIESVIAKHKAEERAEVAAEVAKLG